MVTTTSAIYYHPEAYSISGDKLMGRNAAGESFLRAYFRFAKVDTFCVHVQKKQHAELFSKLAKSHSRNESVKWVTNETISLLKDAGAVYYPGPGINEHARHRSLFGNASWSLCGITHTTSSANAMDAITDILTAPVQPWDALICTSHSVRANVERLLQAQLEYLKDRLSVSKLVLPQFPVIPLGIHTEDFVFSQSQKNKARESLKIAKDTIIILYVGRLSFHAKAHPLAMYQALERAANITKKKIVLVECGWYANDFIQKSYEQATEYACPSIERVVLDGRDAENRQFAWASADIFCSLSDNIQETFGITPLEAMASGIPVVVSDWDGYKESVRDGLDGFRIPTTMPQSQLGVDLSTRHALGIDSYDTYCGLTCSFVSVDIEKTTDAFVKLIKSKALRKKMGEAGRLRTLDVYDWKNIIPQYESLWADLNQIRANHKNATKLANPWPARMDPFDSFSNYATSKLTLETKLALVAETAEDGFKSTNALLQLTMINYAVGVLPTFQEIEAILYKATGAPRSVFDFIQDVSIERKPIIMRGINWLLKVGVLKVVAY